MRKVFGVIAAFALLFVATPVYANHTNDYFLLFEGEEWNESITRSICVSPDFEDNLGGAQFNNALDAMRDTPDAWEQATQLDNIFSVPSATCGDMPFPQEWADAGGSNGAFCNNVPTSRPSSFQFDNLDTSAVAQTVTCDRDNNGKIDYLVIAFNTDYVDTFNYKVFEAPTAGQPYDFYGMSIHEFGHGIGFDGGPTNNGHMSSPCPFTILDRETMCSGTWAFTYQNGGVAGRSVESHEVAETNENY